MYEQCIQKIGETNINIIVRNIMHKIALYNLKNIYSAPIDKFKRSMKRSDFYSMSILLEEKVNVCQHATMPNIMNRNKTISMAALFKQPLFVSSEFLC